jgi:hypothetical protein
MIYFQIAIDADALLRFSFIDAPDITPLLIFSFQLPFSLILYAFHY